MAHAIARARSGAGGKRTADPAHPAAVHTAGSSASSNWLAYSSW